MSESTEARRMRPEDVRSYLRENGPSTAEDVRRGQQSPNPGRIDGVEKRTFRLPNVTSIGGPKMKHVWFLVNGHSAREVLDAWLEANEWLKEETGPQAVMSTTRDTRYEEVAPDAAKEFYPEEAWDEAYAQHDNDGGSRDIYEQALAYETDV